MKESTSSILTLESALTDVLCIVFAFAILEIMSASTINFLESTKTLVMLFVIAGIIGFIAGILWILMIAEIFKDHTHFMLTIAYMIVVYVVAELFGGNGAIATLSLGITLKNSRQITSKIIGLINKKGKEENKKLEEIEGTIAITHTESNFYDQISFFLKTFFFVYIGILFSITSWKIALISIIISVAVLFTRKLSYIMTKGYTIYDKEMIKAIFARGLAAAAIAQLVLAADVARATEIANITYNVIIFTIILSSGMVFWVNTKYSAQKFKENS